MKDYTTWSAMADPTRRQLVELLRDGPRTTGDLCRSFPTTRFAVMKHLDVLHRAGLVTVRREGRHRWNQLNPAPLRELGGRWAGVMPAADRADAASTPGLVHPEQLEIFIDAVPWRVFDALSVRVSEWWGAPYVRGTDASALVLEPQPGGRFYEAWGHREGAMRGIVSAVRQDRLLELRGEIFDPGVPAMLAVELEARERGTFVVVRASGAPREVLEDLFCRRLKGLVEDGTRSGIGS